MSAAPASASDAVMFDAAGDRVLVTGSRGFLGSYVCEALLERGVAPSRLSRIGHSDYELTREAEVRRMFAEHPADVVIHLAAEVGGIGANRVSPGRFFYANFAMGLNLVEQARIAGVRKFVHVGTVCGYPRTAPVPFREEDLWSGAPDPTTAPYGVAKTTLSVMLDAYHREYGLDAAVLIPVNLYGPGDNFDLETGHVVASLIRRFVEAERSGASSVTCWGTGEATREFLYVAEAAEAIVRATERVNDPQPINVGTGVEVRISDLADRIAGLVGYDGEILWDPEMPDGQPRRCLDTTRAADRLDWQASLSLDEGLRRTINAYRKATGA